jgi:hypothetical protein
LSSTTLLRIIPIWQFRCQNKECGAVVSFESDRTYRNQDDAFELYDRRFDK